MVSNTHLICAQGYYVAIISATVETNEPEKEIQRLMFRWKDQWDSRGGPAMRLTYNTTRHQFRESECGMYCLHFHYACLMGLPMNKRISDEKVNAERFGPLFKSKKKEQ